MGHFRLNFLDSRGGGVFSGFGRGIVEIRGATGLGKNRELNTLFFYERKWETHRRSSGRGIVMKPRGLSRAGLGGDELTVRPRWENVESSVIQVT